MTDKNDESAEARAYAEQMWKERQKRYEQAGKDRGVDSEFDSYAERARILFDNDRLRDWVFAPFRAAFHTQGDVTSRQVRRTITGVALANAVLAGLPGKLGIGVAVSMALEAFMALRIAQHVGITSIRTPRDTSGSSGHLVQLPSLCSGCSSRYLAWRSPSSTWSERYPPPFWRN